MLSDRPIGMPKDWLRRLNRAEGQRELQVLRRSANRGQAHGSNTWVEPTTKRFGLESAFRPQVRPRKESSANGAFPDTHCPNIVHRPGSHPDCPRCGKNGESPRFTPEMTHLQVVAERSDEPRRTLADQVLALLPDSTALMRGQLRATLCVQNQRLGPVLEVLEKSRRIRRTSTGWQRVS